MTKTGILGWVGRGLAALLILVLLWNVWMFLHILAWRWINPSDSAFMQTQLERLQLENPAAQLEFEWVDYPQISPHLKRAVVAAEDAKFLDHEGFDWEGLQTAWEKNIQKGRVVAGGSTITQQLAKNLFLSGSRNPLRKVEEAVLTVMIEALLDKRRIFEIYLNVIEWGDGVFGAQAAAQHYYRIDAKKLSASQSAKLASMVTNPRYFDQNRKDRRLLRKAAIIQRRMPYAEIP